MNETEVIDIEQKLKDYEEIVTGFRNLLMTENEALNSYDIERVKSLYAMKEKTVSAYRNLVAFFIRNKTLLAEADAKRREHLKELSTALEDLIKQNDMLLKSRIETSETVMNAIVSAAKMMNNINSTSYGAGEKYSPSDNRKNAIAVNGTF